MGLHWSCAAGPNIKVSPMFNKPVCARSMAYSQLRSGPAPGAWVQENLVHIHLRLAARAVQAKPGLMSGLCPT